MEFFQHLGFGFGVALAPLNLLYSFLGVLLGTLIGVLPGLGPVATISILLPVTFSLEAHQAIIMLAGIFYGAQYGGSTTAILVNLPGESSAVVTALDGYQMARQGRAGAALATAALASFLAGTVGTLLIALAGPLLSKVALAFGAADYFSLMVFGLVGAVILAHGSVIKAIGMIFIGLLLGTVGMDFATSVTRFTFRIPQLGDGVELAVVAMGLFGLGETINNLGRPEEARGYVRVSRIWPRLSEMKEMLPAAWRGTALGCFLGVLPGGGPTLSAFSAYSLEKKIARDPSRFGRGAIEGVAAPEAANNAAAQTSFIPLLTLGIPSNAVMALMIGALMMQGLTPGPTLMNQRPELFWGLIASMWVGNLMLVILNLPLIGLWAKCLTIPYRILYPTILVVCCLGVYSINNSALDVVFATGFGFFGWAFYRLGCEPAPLLLGLILGPRIEENLRQALLISRGDASVFVERPISLTFLVLTAGLLVLLIAPSVRTTRAEAFEEG